MSILTIRPDLIKADARQKSQVTEFATTMATSSEHQSSHDYVFVVPILLFGALYTYGMLDQAPSSVLSTFEYYLFAALIPALLIATSMINVYGLLKSRRSPPRQQNQTKI